MARRERRWAVVFSRTAAALTVAVAPLCALGGEDGGAPAKAAASSLLSPAAARKAVGAGSPADAPRPAAGPSQPPPASAPANVEGAPAPVSPLPLSGAPAATGDPRDPAAGRGKARAPAAAGRGAGGPGIGDAALAAALERQWPFSRRQVGTLFRLFKKMTAATRMRTAPPKLARRTVTVSLAPTAPPMIARVAPDYPTALSFVDVTGAPWPVARVMGDTAFFGGGEAKAGTAIVYITPVPDDLGAVFNGSIMVELQGLETPLVFDLRAHARGEARRIDSALELRIPRPGPEADPADLIDAPAFEAGDAHVAAFLAGAPPASARRLSVTPAREGLRAWRLGKSVYLRTFGRVILPAPLAGERSPGGAAVYKLPDTPRALIALDGRKVSLSVRQRRYAAAGAEHPFDEKEASHDRR